MGEHAKRKSKAPICELPCGGGIPLKRDIGRGWSLGGDFPQQKKYYFIYKKMMCRLTQTEENFYYDRKIIDRLHPIKNKFLI